MSIAAGLKIAFEVLNVVSFAIDVADKMVDVLKNAGVIKNTANSDELGAKVIRGTELGITPQNLKNWEDYEKYIRQIDSVDLTSLPNYTPEQKREAANEFITGAMNMKYRSASGVNDFLQEVNNNADYYSPERIETYMEKSEQKNMNMENIGRYFDSKLDSLQDVRKTESVLLSAERTLNVDENQAKTEFDSERARRLTKDEIKSERDKIFQDI